MCTYLNCGGNKHNIRMLIKLMSKKDRRAFTLIELVVIAIIAILVLLGVGMYKGNTREAKLAKHLTYVKELEAASERFYIDEKHWPRLGDEPYTNEELIGISEKITDITGEDIVLDPEGSYYPIDYAALAKHTKIPKNTRR